MAAPRHHTDSPRFSHVAVASPNVTGLGNVAVLDDIATDFLELTAVLYAVKRLEPEIRAHLDDMCAAQA